MSQIGFFLVYGQADTARHSTREKRSISRFLAKTLPRCGCSARRSDERQLWRRRSSSRNSRSSKGRSRCRGDIFLLQCSQLVHDRLLSIGMAIVQLVELDGDLHGGESRICLDYFHQVALGYVAPFFADLWDCLVQVFNAGHGQQ